jgi:hypothetical protein
MVGDSAALTRHLTNSNLSNLDIELIRAHSVRGRNTPRLVRQVGDGRLEILVGQDHPQESILRDAFFLI